MKRIALLLAVASVISFSSCKKTWTCQCTDNNNNTTYHEIGNSTLHDADKTCNNFEFNTGGSYNNCSLIQ